MIAVVKPSKLATQFPPDQVKLLLECLLTMIQIYKRNKLKKWEQILKKKNKPDLEASI